MKKPYTAPTVTELAPDDPRALALAATLAPMNTPPRSKAAVALELARTLSELAKQPAGRALLRGLESALPEASALVRGALSDPAATIAEALAPMAEAAADELAECDRTIAAGFARALGRGVARGVRRPPR